MKKLIVWMALLVSLFSPASTFASLVLCAAIREDVSAVQTSAVGLMHQLDRIAATNDLAEYTNILSSSVIQIRGLAAEFFSERSSLILILESALKTNMQQIAEARFKTLDFNVSLPDRNLYAAILPELLARQCRLVDVVSSVRRTKIQLESQSDKLGQLADAITFVAYSRALLHEAGMSDSEIAKLTPELNLLKIDQLHEAKTALEGALEAVYSTSAALAVIK